MVKAQLAGYHAITPYLVVRKAADAIAFYARAFGASEIMRLPMPDGRLGHAEIRIGDSVVMPADEFPEQGVVGPETLGNTTASLLVYVEDVDAAFAKALAAGATELYPLRDQFYGDRNGTLRDPFGHKWTLATHKEDVSEEEMQRRMAALGEGQG